jgi:hypothetical protein
MFEVRSKLESIGLGHYSARFEAEEFNNWNTIMQMDDVEVMAHSASPRRSRRPAPANSTLFLSIDSSSAN